MAEQHQNSDGRTLTGLVHDLAWCARTCATNRETCARERQQYRDATDERLKRLETSMPVIAETQRKHLDAHANADGRIARGDKLFLAILGAIITLVGPMLNLLAQAYLKP